MNFLINISNVIDYVGGGLRAYVEGENVLKANHLMYVGIISKKVEEIKIMSLCLKSSDLFGPPHEINLVINIVNRINISCICSCKAGQSGKCKHSVALLMYLTRTDIEDIEESSCTDVKQKWGKLKENAKLMYEVTPIKKFCHGVQQDAPQNIESIPEHILDNVFQILLQSAPESELSKTIKGYRSSVNNEPVACMNVIKNEDCKVLLSAQIYFPIKEDTILYVTQINDSICNITLKNMLPQEREFYEQKVCITVEDAVLLCSNTQTQKSCKWFHERKKRITASTAYSFLTYINNKNPDWDTKIKKHLDNKFEGNASTRYGTQMEPKARKCFERCTGLVIVQTGLLVNPVIPWLGYSSDGIVVGEKIIEIKCPIVGKKQGAAEMIANVPWIDQRSENISIKKKHSYYCQIQLGMFISNIHKCDLVVYSSLDDNCVIINVQYDSELVLNEYIPKLQTVYFMQILKHLCNETHSPKD